MLKLKSPVRSVSDDALLQLVKTTQAIIQFLPDGTILEANEAFCAAVGYNLAEIQGRHHRIFCAPEIANSAEYERFWADLRAGKSFTSRYDRGKIERVVKIATDVTPARKAMQAVLVAMQALESGQLDQQIPLVGIEEFDAIAKAFNASVAKL